MENPQEAPREGSGSFTERTRRAFGGFRVLPSLFAGVMSGTLVIIISLSLATLIFRGDLAARLPAGVGIALASAMILGIVSTLGSSFRAIIAYPQEAPAVIFAIVASSISEQMKGADSAADPFPTIIVTMGLTSIIAGGFFLALGLLRMGKIVRYIPFPVISGFLAGTGWLLVTGSLSVMTNMPLHFKQILLLLKPDVLVHWVPGMTFGLALTLLLRRFRHYLLMPGLIVAGIAVFYLALLITGTSIAQAERLGLFLGAIPPAGFWPPLHWEDAALIDWRVVLQQGDSISAVTILAAVSILLNASGIELATEMELDLDRELRVTGLANIAAGLLGGQTGYLSLSESTLNHRVGADSRVSGVVSALICAAALVFGAGVLSYLPKPILGGLLVFPGLVFLLESIYDERLQLSRGEYTIVWLILIVVAVVGFLEGVAFGIVISSILFVLNYSRINVVRHAISGADLRSNIDRREVDEQILDKKGNHTQIFQLQGYIFFGTAFSLQGKVTSVILTKSPLPVRYVLLDFRHVDGLDSSAIVSFMNMKAFAKSQFVTLVLTDLPPNAAQQLERCGCIDEPSVANPACRSFKDLDHGLEWCESQLIFTNTMVMKKTTTLSLELEQSFDDRDLIPILMSYFERVEAEAGYKLFGQGEISNAMYLIESGETTAWLELEGGGRRRLRTMGPGTVVGESGVYMGGKRSATVLTNGPTVVYRLSNEALAKLTEEAPRVAAAFHEFVARLLAKRMVHATKAVQKIFY